MIKWALVYIIMIQGDPAPVLVTSYSTQEQCEAARHVVNVEKSEKKKHFALVCVPEKKYSFRED